MNEIEEYFELTNNFYFVIIDKSNEKRSNVTKYTRDELEIVRKNISDMERQISNYLSYEVSWINLSLLSGVHKNCNLKYCLKSSRHAPRAVHKIKAFQ